MENVVGLSSGVAPLLVCGEDSVWGGDLQAD